ncbi:MAG TPA: TlyA family RNA methyltransferase [Bacillota bacterium]|nr:TlyA family RNA methyltransferase [Bacillota bacterium]
MSKQRLDVLLVEKKLADSREKAKRLIMAGLVFSEQIRLEKPGMKVAKDLPITVKGNDCPYVSRGGLKLAKALEHFSINIKNRRLIDIGASTGGFTDCALQHGAKLSYAIDVGYNQLAWKLRSDPRVIVMERTNFRYVTEDMLKHGIPNLATIDVSFISLKLILPVLKQLLAHNSDVIALVKPQFEAGKEQVEKGGLIRQPNVHIDVLQRIITFATEQSYHCLDVTYSPITGGKGNIEFLVHFGWQKTTNQQVALNIEQVVKDAHKRLL